VALEVLQVERAVMGRDGGDGFSPASTAASTASAGQAHATGPDAGYRKKHGAPPINGIQGPDHREAMTDGLKPPVNEKIKLIQQFRTFLI
jgi:hypothetical protein